MSYPIVNTLLRLRPAYLYNPNPEFLPYTCSRKTLIRRYRNGDADYATCAWTLRRLQGKAQRSCEEPIPAGVTVRLIGTLTEYREDESHYETRIVLDRETCVWEVVK